MRMTKNVLRKVGLLIILCIIFTGCGKKETESASAGEAVYSETKGQTQTEVKEAEEVLSKASLQVITDMAGREVEVPTKIEKVFSVNNNGTILLYTLCPEKMIGWNSKISEGSKSYMNANIASLPMLGVLYGNSSQSNPEGIIMAQPDIILFMDANADEKIIKAANKIELEMKIPVVVIKGGLSSYDKAYKFVGNLLGMEEEAKALSEYYKESFDKVKNIVESIPDEEKVKVYYAREKDGLSTETNKSPNAQLIKLCGGVNVAVSEDTSIKSPIVSIEQVMMWNPDVIFTGNAGFVSQGTYQEVTTSEKWAGISAVAKGAVYPTPQVPFNWFDRPPSVNRIVGINYVLYTLYPDYYEGDIVEDVRKFYELFYHYELSEEEAKAFLNLVEE